MRALLTLLATLSCLATEVTNLPLVRLQVGAPIEGGTRVACTVNLTLVGTPQPTAAAPHPGQIKLHGATSQGYDKKSFSLKLAQNVNWLGLPKNRDWILNAAFVDFSMMRHKLSYDLFQSLTTPSDPRFAASSRFVEVELNGRYHGVYLLMQKVEGSLLEFPHPAPNATGPALLYKATGHAANFSQPGHADYEQKEPEPSSGEYWAPLDTLNQFVCQASPQDFFDVKKGIASRLDLANAIDFHLLVLLTCNVDGITKNYYLARRPTSESEPPTKFFFVPWDYDGTFGRNWDGSPLDERIWLSNRLFDRLLSAAEYRQKFAQRWRELRAQQFTVENLNRMIDENAKVLGESAKRNEQRWRKIDEKNPQAFTSLTDIGQMKAWTAKRLTWLDAEIARQTKP